MTDHYINAELCRNCLVKRICSALVADGSWNPYLAVVQGGPCRALVRGQGKVA